MVNVEYFDEPVSVAASVNGEGQVTLQKMTWQDRSYTIVAIGRQWDEEDGRHVLAESAEGMRFELQLSRQDFIWRLKRAWREQLAA
jgi:hypothetical protein